MQILQSNNVKISHVTETLDKKGCLAQDSVNHLREYGGNNQLIMLLTGPAGAGKSTAVQSIEKFYTLFCRHVPIPWIDSTYLYTAYTGSASALFNGVTICKKAGIKTKKQTTTTRVN